MATAAILVTPPQSGAVEVALLDALAGRLTRAFGLAAGRIRERVGIAATAAIQACPEYASLLTGDLKGQLGVVDAASVLKEVCVNVASGVAVTSLGVRRTGFSLDGGVRVELLKGDYSEVLSADGASFVSEGGYQIDWLRWLTLEGDRIIVADHHYAAGFGGRSRTGMGIMRRSGTWRVPPEFSGTDSDNWITRALGTIGPEVELILGQEIQKHL